MAGIQIAEARAPWVMFETRAVEDRAASIESGMYKAKDVDYALITPHGSRDQIDREVAEWFEYLAGEVKSERFPPAWLKAYKAAYAEWKEGKATPLTGTPVANWPILSPAQVKLLQDLHVLTVEVLADANEETMRRMGMGAVALVAKAKEWVAQSKQGVNVEQTVALNQKVEDQAAIIEKQQEQIAMLLSRLPELPPSGPATDTNAKGITSSDLLDKDVVTQPVAPKKL